MFRFRPRPWCLVGGLAAIAATAPAQAFQTDELPPAATSPVDFSRDIQPILVRSCLECHGPSQQKGGLRLDRKAEAFAGGDSGPMFDAGQSADSLLIEKVAGLDPLSVMPPKGDRLTGRQIGLLRAWIDQGAPWPDDLELASATATEPGHWAFQTPKRPTVPTVRHADRVANPIDAFVLSKLEPSGLSPNPEADRRTLIRRLSLDLTGLPPTPAEVEAFVADDRSDAYERLVDRLLASPHFGERWGRHWLDLARYADSDGYEKDSPRPFAYRYRDWVINAFNRDMPFDQFTIEQLAGDLLPESTLDQRIATGFHRNTLTNKEGGVDQEEFRVAAIVDRVNTTGTVWLGLTVACAQCHSHKYDPIPQKDFYGLFAFFNNADEQDIPAPLPGEIEAYNRAKASFDREHQPFLAAFERYERERRPQAQSDWEATARNTSDRPSRWTALEITRATSAGGATFQIQPDRSVLVDGPRSAADTYTFEVALDSPVSGITAFRVEALDDPTLPSKGPGRNDNGNFVLTEFKVTVQASGRDEPARKVALRHAQADHAQAKFPPADAIDGQAKTGWAVGGQTGRRHVAVFETKTPLALASGETLVVTLDQLYGGRHTLGRLRLAWTTAEPPIVLDDLPNDIAEILALDAEARDDAQLARLAEYHRGIDPELAKLRRAAEEHARKAPKPPTSKAPTLAERTRDRRRTHILTRGDFLRPGAEVEPHALSALPPLKPQGAEPTRLDLARWLVDPDNPLTARVQVNRIWRHLFGRALVPSMEDLGTRGEPPSHPDLLDWLATEFVRLGWSQKAVIKTIVLSSTYRQSSAVRPDLLERDPNNTLLARQARYRLEAESLRDLSLAVSGLLSPRIGGPSVRPPQPPGIAELTYAGSAKWVESQGADRYRRGMYTWFQRTSPYPMLMTFDAPDGNVCAVKRERSNTPLQALTLLNDAVFVECAQALARRLLTDPEVCDCTDGRIDAVFQIGLARLPSPEEAETVNRLFADLLDAAQAQPEAAARLVGPNPPANADPAEAAAWVALARAMLNLDEFVTRE